MTLYAVHTPEDAENCAEPEPVPVNENITLAPGQPIWCGVCGKPRQQQDIPDKVIPA